MNKQLAQWTEAYRTGAPLGGPRGGGFELGDRGFGSSGSSGAGFGGSGSSGPGLGRLVLVLTTIIALVAGAIVAARSLAGGRSEPTAQPTRSASAVPVPTSSAGRARVNGQELPPPGVEESPSRLLPPVAAPAGTGGYAFESPAANGGSVTYDPCRPIHYVVRPTNEPPGGAAVVQESIAAVSAATGLRFVDDGATDEAPSNERAAFQPERYGQRWAPVLITWSDPRESRGLAGSTIGTGGSQALTLTKGATSETAYVTGNVTLDAPQLRQTLAEEGRQAVRGVVEHELGHVVGLAHVNDRKQLMYPESALAVSRYQAGDLRGLAILGNGPCTPDV